MFSVCPHLGGGYPSQVELGGGVPKPGPAGGRYPDWGGTLWGTLMWGGTRQGVSQLGGTPTGGYPTGVGTPLWLTDGVLDKRRSVCLLRSRRRTFLFLTYV